MTDELGTRIRVNQPNNRIDQGAQTRYFTRDQGMQKLVSDLFTFSASTGHITGTGAAEFGVFAVWDPIEVFGSNLNDGYYTIIFVDPGGIYITVDPPPKSELASSPVQIRTS